MTHPPLMRYRIYALRPCTESEPLIDWLMRDGPIPWEAWSIGLALELARRDGESPYPVGALGWLETRRLVPRVLAGADLAGADLSGLDLSEVDLQGANLRGADLRDANLAVAWLWKADLTDACLDGANMRFTLLPDAEGF